MKLIFEYEESITGHVPAIQSTNERDGNNNVESEGEEDVLHGLPKELVRKELALPNVSEVDVVRHYTNMSRMNYGVDLSFYPLGSCTMKYNPKINEDVARLPGFARLHPLAPEAVAQGALRLMHELAR